MIEFITETTLEIPMIQVMLLMLISTVSLLFGKLRLALLINYIFILNWAYIINRDLLLDMGPAKFQYISALYFIFGVVVILIAVFSFMFQKDQN